MFEKRKLKRYYDSLHILNFFLLHFEIFQSDLLINKYVLYSEPKV